MAMTSRIIAVLVLAVASIAATQAHGGREPHMKVVRGRAAGGVAGKKMCEYKIEVKTGDVYGAGTNSRLSIGVGDKDLIMNMDINDADAEADVEARKFQRGKLDVLVDEAPYLDLCLVGVRTEDKKVVAPNWYCEYVRVTLSGDASVQKTFKVSQWLGPYEDRYVVTLDECVYEDAIVAMARAS